MCRDKVNFNTVCTPNLFLYRMLMKSRGLDYKFALSLCSVYPTRTWFFYGITHKEIYKNSATDF